MNGYAFKPNDRLWRNYIIQAPLGQGGMAEIYRVTNQRGEVFAAKVVRQDRMNNPFLLPQFRYEVEIHPKFQHQNILKVFEVYPHEMPPGMIMMFAPGGTLRDQIAEGIKSDQIMTIIKQIGSSLAYLHRLGYVHCDLKPDNILVDGNGNYLLTDFGIAQSIGLPPETKRGTPRYMTPEQYRLMPVDQRTDVYAFGIMLYEVLTGGELPFTLNEEGSNTEASLSSGMSLEEQHLSREPVPPSFYNKRIRTQFDHIILKSLRKEPAARYANIEDMIKHLEDAFSGREDAGYAKTNAIRIPIHQTSGIKKAQIVATKAPQGHSLPQIALERSMQFGRRKDCQIVLAVDNISRRHAMIQWDDIHSQYAVFDQGSSIGTRVNGKLLPSNRRYYLVEGDLITIGDFNFRFEQGN